MVEEPKTPSKPTKEQSTRIRELIDTLADERPDVDWREFAQDAAGVPGNMLTATLADVVIDTLAAELGAEPKAAA